MRQQMYLVRGMPRLSRLAFIVLTILLMPVSLSAQATALLTGTVVDPSGAVIAGANVVCQNTQTGLTYNTATTSSGIFRFPSLPIGNYDLTVDQAGFQRFVRTGLTLLTGNTVDLRLQLKVGSTRQSVTVNAPAPVVQPTSSVVQATINQTSVQDLPLNGRNPLQLVGLIPGSIQTSGVNSWQGNNNEYAVNGNRGTDDTFLLDGVNYTDPHWNIAATLPNPDAIQEFTVKASNFDASQIGAGANVQYSLRSGTNQFHGSAFEFVRNNDFDSRNFFASTVTRFVRNQFGGTFGGPIIKNKTFFFASFQPEFIRGGASPAIMTVPSAALRQGNFTSENRTIVDPTTGVAFPSDTIPTARMNDIDQKLLPTIPLPPASATGAVVNVTGKPLTASNDYQFSLRLDHSISDRDRLSGHWFYDNLTFQTGTSPLPDYYANTIFHNQNFMVSETHTFTPNLMFVGTIGYTRVPREQTPVPPPFTMQSLGAIAPYPEGGVGPEVRVNFTNYSSLNNGGQITVHPTQVQYRGKFVYMRSKHMVQFGADLTHTTEFALTPAQGAGNWNYNGSITTKSSIPNSGDTFADFLLGLPYSFSQQGASPQDIAGSLLALHVGDDWKVLPRLTLNLGLRWDPETPPTDNYDAQTGFEAGVQSVWAPHAPLGLVFSGDPGLRHSIIPDDWRNFAPRIGFAYDVAGNGRTVVRSSYGIFYRPDLMNILRFSSNTSAGRGLVVSLGPTVTDTPYAGYAAGDPFPAWHPPKSAADYQAFIFPNPVSTSGIDSQTRTSYVQEWNFTVERQLTPSLGVSVAYLGNHMVKGIDSTEGNPALYGPGATAANANSRRPYAGIASLQMVSPFQFSNYNGLQFNVTKHAGRGLNFIANYTYSRCMDNDTTTVGTVTVSNKLNPNAGYAPCSFNLAQVANVSVEYSLPRVPYFRGVSDKALNHWELTSILNVDSGSRFGIVSGVLNSLSGPTTNSGTNDEALQVSANSARPAGALPLAEWFNTAAFAPNTIGTYGDSQRDALIGPKTVGWDIGLMKHIPITERVNLQFRFEAFNFPNHPNFNNPVATQSSSQFGQITSAGNPRVIQLALKLSF